MSVVRVVTPPAYEPLTVAEFQAWAKIDDADTEEALIELLIQAMREHAEEMTGRAFIPRTLQLVLPEWPTLCVHGSSFTGIRVPQPPLRYVTSITYTDPAGAEQTLAADQYVVHTDQEPGLIVPAWQVSWPALRWVIDAVRVNYIAGYAPDGSPDTEAAYQAGLPAKLRLWVQARAATFHQNREQLVHSSRIKIPKDFADGLLDSLVIGSRLF